MKTMLILTALVLCTAVAFAQSPQSFQYQAVVRDAGGNPITDQNVGVQISILQGSVSGTSVFTEAHNATTNSYGIVTLTVGGGVVESGDFSLIDWSNGLYFLKVEIDPAGGTSYVDMGATQLLSVPYALYSSQSASSVNDLDTDPTNEIQVLSFSNDTLYLSNGGFVSLAGFSDTLWRQNGVDIFNTNTGKVGVGTNIPPAKFVVQGDSTMADTIPLFEVKDRSGATVFIIYPDSARLYVGDDGSKTNKGAFAVSGRNTAKQLTNNYLWITPDSTRVYTGDTIKGFGVKNINSTGEESYLQLTPDNYFIGHQAGQSITTGLYNSFIGYQSGYSNTVGSKNYFIGYKSGYSNIDGYSNIFIGDSAGYDNTSGFRNVIIGNQSGLFNQTGKYNVIMGYESGRDNISGSNNTFMGYRAGYGNSTGSNNVFIGYKVGRWNSTGTSNVVIGDSAGFWGTSSSYNVFLGRNAGCANTANFNVFLGYESGMANTTGTNNAFMGYLAGRNNTSGSSNVIIGDNAGWTNTTGSQNVFLGYYAGNKNNANNNVFLGFECGYSNTSGSNNTFMGYKAGRSNTTGYDNIIIGKNAGYSNQVAYTSVLIGNQAGYTFSNGEGNVFIGDRAGYRSSSSAGNVFIGIQAGSSFEVSAPPHNTDNVMIGTGAGLNFGGGDKNVLIGGYCGKWFSGNSNVYIGFQSANQKTSGNSNVMIGSYAGLYNTSGSGNVFIGYDAGRDETGSNKLYISNTYTNPPLIYGDFSTGRIGLGTTSPTCPLDVQRTTTISGITYYYYAYGSGNMGLCGGCSGPYSIRASGRILASEFDATSDSRVKRIINDYYKESNIELINGLKVTRYNYIDEVQSGNKVRTGFIAQQVEEIFPDAVNLSQNFIPDVYDMSSSFAFDKESNKATIKIEKPHNFIKGDEVRIYTEKNYFDCVVENIISEEVFVVSEWNEDVDMVFVYGKKVDDFRSIDYDVIFSTGIGAIQELSKQVDDLQKKLSQMENESSARIERISNENEILKTEIEIIKNKLFLEASK